MKWTYPESSGWHSGWRTIFGVCPYEFGLRWDISGHWYRGFTQNFDTFYMGIVVWPEEPFLKKWPNIRKSIFVFKICMYIFQGTGSQDEFFPKRPPAAFSKGELEGRSPSKMQVPPRMIYLYKLYLYICTYIYIYTHVYIIYMIQIRVIPEWLVLEYFQIHGLYRNG